MCRPCPWPRWLYQSRSTLAPERAEGLQSYAIRTGTFETRPPAEATAAMFREFGADAAVAPAEGDASSYVVWIGPYASLADARLIETAVKQRFGFLDARIVARALPNASPP